MNLPVFSRCTKCLDGSELSIFHMGGEAPQWDFRRRLENVQKKPPLSLLFEKLKGGGGERHRCCVSVSFSGVGFALLTCQASGYLGSFWTAAEPRDPLTKL